MLFNTLPPFFIEDKPECTFFFCLLFGSLLKFAVFLICVIGSNSAPYYREEDSKGNNIHIKLLYYTSTTEWVLSKGLVPSSLCQLDFGWLLSSLLHRPKTIATHYASLCMVGKGLLALVGKEPPANAGD